MSDTVSGQATSYTWNVGAELPVILQDGTNSYVYGLGLISATDGSGAQTYYLYDGLGSTANLTDGSGATAGTYSYDVLGAIRSQTGGGSNQWLFAGEQRDGDSSFYYLRARYYDPSTGRFITRDPLGEGNGYSYAFNNPVNLVDPYGLFGCGDLGPLGGACQEGWDALEAGANVAVDLAVQTANTAASAVAGCWQSTLCRTLSVEAGVFACSAFTGGWGAVGCAAAGALVLSYDEAVDCVEGSTVSCVNVGMNVGISAASAGAGYFVGREVRWFQEGYRSNIGIHPPHHSFLEHGGKRMPHIESVRFIRGGESGNQIIWRQPLPRWWPNWDREDGGLAALV